MKIVDNEEPCCSKTLINGNSRMATENETKINQYNKNTSTPKKNWFTTRSNDIRSKKRPLFSYKPDEPILLDYDSNLSINNSATQTEPDISASSVQLLLLPKNVNNNVEKNTTVAACVTENKQISPLANFSNCRKSRVKQKVSPEAVMKPAEESESKIDGSGNRQHDNQNHISDFLSILGEVSLAMKMKYMPDTDHTKSTKESPREPIVSPLNTI